MMAASVQAYTLQPCHDGSQRAGFPTSTMMAASVLAYPLQL